MACTPLTLDATLPSGRPIAFGLPATPSAGYQWTWEGAGVVLTESFLPTRTAAPSAVGPLLGGAGVHLFTVAPLTPGTYQLHFVYHRAWDAAPPVATADVTLRVIAL